MSSTRIILSVKEETLPEKEIILAEPGDYVIGRAPDCGIKIPADECHIDVSRHHCVLEIQPEHIQVRDLGSLNGTFVNGEKIGQRPLSRLLDEESRWPSAAHALNDGDELRVGGIHFRVVMSGPVVIG
jgi:pSer/pThr/pTyr-binding forkhead associated (FHA) protein